MGKIRLAVLASGGGTNFEAVALAAAQGELEVEMVGLITSTSKAGALDRARALGIPTACLNQKDYEDLQQWDKDMSSQLQSWGAQYVLAAGFLKKIGPNVLDQFQGKIINTHPALLPKHGGPGMYGLRVHQAVISAGDRETGITLHIVTPEYDKGPVIAQAKIAVVDGETAESLQTKVKEEENKFIVRGLKEFFGSI